MCFTQNGRANTCLQLYTQKYCELIVVLVPKQYNLRRHFETQQPNLAELDANEKRLKT